ncbi:MAG: CoB--CoM heterodisulfide reductase iron-sulfur subunit B family protein [bacterium]
MEEERTVRYAYYPGCSLETSAVEYDMSLRAVCKKLGIELVELKDWCCCGATSAHMTDELLSVSLPAENLLLAEKMGLDLVTACAACFSSLKTASKRIETEPEVASTVEHILGAKPDGSSRVLHAIDVVNRELEQEASDLISVRLKDLNVAPYYGCLLLRPPKVKEFDDPENPTKMNVALEATGANVVAFSHATICCGASFTATEPSMGLKLSEQILYSAQKAGAECLAVACPMCHTNLDLNQEDIERLSMHNFGIPVLYFTQILGVAMGIDPEELGLHKNVVEPWNLLARYINVDAMEYR